MPFSQTGVLPDLPQLRLRFPVAKVAADLSPWFFFVASSLCLPACLASCQHLDLSLDICLPGEAVIDDAFPAFFLPVGDLA